MDGSSQVNVMLSSESSGRLKARRMDSVNWRYPSGPGLTWQAVERSEEASGQGQGDRPRQSGKQHLPAACSLHTVLPQAQLPASSAPAQLAPLVTSPPGHAATQTSHLEAVRAPIKVDVHDSWRVGAALRRQRGLPVRQPRVAELAVRLLSETKNKGKQEGYFRR